jgi:sensor c-di-GMP phosphodiesterase-like protein
MAAATMWREEKTLLARLKQALKAKELTVAYQPIVDLNSGRVITAEAIVRWTDQAGTTIPPDMFLSAAEEAGTAGAITTYVLRTVVSQTGPFLRQNPSFGITVNIVAADLGDGGFYAALKNSIRDAGISANQISLELTTRSSVDLEIAVPAIVRLRNVGHHVYLDDFGTGHSSLANLQKLKVDMIKLDRAFSDMVGNAVKVSIVPQILDIARALELRVVIQGIATEEQRAYFAAAMPSCMGQGSLISRPLTVVQLLAFHQQHR